MATRRLSRAHHEFRFGRRELGVLGAVFCLIASLVFVAGVVVGREMSRSKARAEVSRESRLTEPDGHRGGDTVKTAATRAEEKVTFYRTLTAPTQDLPQVGKPTVEERMVPKDEPAPTPAPAADAAPAESRAAAPEAPRTEPEAPRAAPERRTPKAPAPDTAHPPPRATRPVRVGAPQPVRPPAQVAAASAASEPEMWTVQVNAFRSRALAEELRARLAARGFDAYVFPSLTEDGRPRYRVRVGAYPARSDAERAATELRSERGLNPLVTPRTTREGGVPPGIQRVLIPAEDLRARVDELGRQLRSDYAGRTPILVGVLKGAVVFLADLMRAIDAPCECDFIAVSSYGASTRSSGIVELTKDLSVPIEGRDVLIVEDIVDTGRTLAYLLRNLETRQPRTVRVCALLDKVSRREVPVALDYVGFAIPDEFVVGYGLDFAGLYRNLPYIGVLDAAGADQA